MITNYADIDERIVDLIKRYGGITSLGVSMVLTDIDRKTARRRLIALKKRDKIIRVRTGVYSHADVMKVML